MSRFCAACIAVGILWGLDAQAQEAERVNPHADPEACGECHEPTAPGAGIESMVFKLGSPDASCSDCHECVPHEVGLVGDAEDDEDAAVVPEGWPLVEGTLGCLTCHDEPACSGESIEPDDRFFFRGGPYSTLGTFCASCHLMESYEKYNPHEAMEEDPDGSEACEFCHENVPETGAEEDELRVASARICEACHHERGVHSGSDRHQVALEATMLERAANAGLPLDEDRVYCGTCHDPHPAGSTVRSEDRVAILGRSLHPEAWAETVLGPVLAERAAALELTAEPRTEEPDYLRLPLHDGALCRSCHELAEIDLTRSEDES